MHLFTEDKDDFRNLQLVKMQKPKNCELLSKIYASTTPPLHLKEHYRREFKKIVRSKTRMCAVR